MPQILCMGGTTRYDADDDDDNVSAMYNGGDDNKLEEMDKQIIPNHVIWRCYKLNDRSYEWRKYYLPRAMHSFGLINYKNKFLFTFGGVNIIKVNVNKNDIEYHIEAMSSIYVLKMEEKTPRWYQFNRLLPEKDEYYAILSKNEKVVNL
eukprot:271947_1